MFFTIDPGGDIPIYEQIVRQTKFAVADGVLVGGQLVPSVRQLAGQLAVNPNTIARAYTQLQNDLVLEPLRGRGLTVRRDALQRCVKARNQVVHDGLRRVVHQALRAGISPDEVIALVQDAITDHHAASNGKPVGSAGPEGGVQTAATESSTATPKPPES